MALTISQRLERLKVRSEELKYWRAREGVTVGGWTVDGGPIEIGGAWPSREGVRKFAATRPRVQHAEKTVKLPVSIDEYYRDPGEFQKTLYEQFGTL